MKDIETTLNWIKAWSISIAVNAAAILAVYWLYADAMQRHGLLGGAR